MSYTDLIYNPITGNFEKTSSFLAKDNILPSEDVFQSEQACSYSMFPVRSIVLGETPVAKSLELYKDDIENNLVYFDNCGEYSDEKIQNDCADVLIMTKYGEEEWFLDNNSTGVYTFYSISNDSEMPSNWKSKGFVWGLSFLDCQKLLKTLFFFIQDCNERNIVAFTADYSYKFVFHFRHDTQNNCQLSDIEVYINEFFYMNVSFTHLLRNEVAIFRSALLDNYTFIDKVFKDRYGICSQGEYHDEYLLDDKIQLFINGYRPQKVSFFRGFLYDLNFVFLKETYSEFDVDRFKKDLLHSIYHVGGDNDVLKQLRHIHDNYYNMDTKEMRINNDYSINCDVMWYEEDDEYGIQVTIWKSYN